MKLYAHIVTSWQELLTGALTKKPVLRTSYIFFVVSPNKLLKTQSCRLSFKTPWHSYEVTVMTIHINYGWWYGVWCLVAQKLSIDQICKSHNADVPYPTLHHSEEKCAYFCSECSILEYGTSALWDLWNWSIAARLLHIGSMAKVGVGWIHTWSILERRFIKYLSCNQCVPLKKSADLSDIFRGKYVTAGLQ